MTAAHANLYRTRCAATLTATSTTKCGAPEPEPVRLSKKPSPPFPPWPVSGRARAGSQLGSSDAERPSLQDSQTYEPSEHRGGCISRPGWLWQQSAAAGREPHPPASARRPARPPGDARRAGGQGAQRDGRGTGAGVEGRRAAGRDGIGDTTCAAHRVDCADRGARRRQSPAFDGVVAGRTGRHGNLAVPGGCGRRRRGRHENGRISFVHAIVLGHVQADDRVLPSLTAYARPARAEPLVSSSQPPEAAISSSVTVFAGESMVSAHVVQVASHPLARTVRDVVAFVLARPYSQSDTLPSGSIVPRVSDVYAAESTIHAPVSGRHVHAPVPSRSFATKFWFALPFTVMRAAKGVPPPVEHGIAASVANVRGEIIDGDRRDACCRRAWRGQRSEREGDERHRQDDRNTTCGSCDFPPRLPVDGVKRHGPGDEGGMIGHSGADHNVSVSGRLNESIAHVI